MFGDLFLTLNIELDRKELLKSIGGSNPPGTTTTQSLYILKCQL